MDLCWQSNVSVLHMLSRLVITFLPRSKHLLILWLQSLSAVIFELKKINLSLFPLFPISVSSVAQLCLTLCNPMDSSMPCFPIHHQLLELAQTHVSEAIQLSHPLSFPSPAFNFSQHQGLFQWVSSSHQVAKILEHQLFSISSSNEYSGLISFRMGWFDLLAV